MALTTATRMIGVAALATLALLAGRDAGMAASPAEAPGASASMAEGIFAAARPKLLLIRTLLASAGQQASFGSGFVVSADGLAVTNYHVVSQYALEPETYRLEYTVADGTKGGLALVGIDVANDLAIVRLDRKDQPVFAFDKRAVAGSLPKGERLYSMGYPLDLGFTIVEGTNNGPVERSYSERIHFSGAINPGMSGGPTVAADGSVAGVNVAKRLDGELVSFLVPARFAAALLQRSADAEALSPKELRAEIGRQLTLWQAGLYHSLAGLGFKPSQFGPYEAPESAAPWFTCWARTNARDTPRPRATVNSTSCNSDTRIFVAPDLSTGHVQLSHSYLRSVDLNQFQFAAFLSQQNSPSWLGGWSRKWMTQQRCREDFMATAPEGEHPPLRALWCARAYREFAGLYDVTVMTLTQDRTGEALVSRLSLQGIAYDNAMALAKSFIEAVRWTR